jgi:hypothetical protein
MADTPHTLPLSCPHCEATLAEIAALSRTVITLTCAACGHGWSMSVAWLPDYVLSMLGGASVDRHPRHGRSHAGLADRGQDEVTN